MFKLRMNQLLLIVFFWSQISFGQKVTSYFIDSLIESHNFGINLSQEANIQKINQIDSLSTLIGHGEGLAYSNLYFGFFYMNSEPEILGNHIRKLDSLLPLYGTAFSEERRAELELLRGYHKGVLGDFLGELKDYLKAGTIARNSGDEKSQSLVNQFLMNYYFMKADYTKAKKFNDENLLFYKAHQDEQGMEVNYFNTLLSAGAIYLELNELDSTILMANQIISAEYNFYLGLNRAYYLLCKSYLLKEDFVQSSYYAEKMKAELGKSERYSRASILTQILLGQLNQKLGNEFIAKRYFESAIYESDSILYEKGQTNARYELLKLHFKTTDQNELVEHLETFVALKDTLYNNESNKFEKQLLIQYETGKKELEIQELKYKNKVNQFSIIGVAIIAIILVLIIVFIIYRYRTKRKLLEKALETEQLSQLVTTKNLELKTRNLNQAVEQLRDNRELIKELEQTNKERKSVDQIVSELDQNYINEAQWVKIMLHFDLLYNDFLKNIKTTYERLTMNDLRLLVLLKLGYSNKGIAEVNNISEDGVKKAKNRLLKKMEKENFKWLENI